MWLFDVLGMKLSNRLTNKFKSLWIISMGCGLPWALQRNGQLKCPSEGYFSPLHFEYMYLYLSNLCVYFRHHWKFFMSPISSIKLWSVAPLTRMPYLMHCSEYELKKNKISHTICYSKLLCVMLWPHQKVFSLLFAFKYSSNCIPDFFILSDHPFRAS